LIKKPLKKQRQQLVAAFFETGLRHEFSLFFPSENLYFHETSPDSPDHSSLFLHFFPAREYNGKLTAGIVNVWLCGFPDLT
jgi:hypothetical protein